MFQLRVSSGPAGFFASLVALFAAVGCTPGSGSFTLEEVCGRVIDLESGDPISGAEVVEWYVGGGPSDGARPVHHARWATSGADGTFVLAASRASMPILVGASRGPKFALVHPDYGLQRQARLEHGVWVLRGDRKRLAQAQQDLQPYCRGERDDEGARRIREVACKRTPSRD